VAFWDRFRGRPENRGSLSGTRTVDESAALRLALESSQRRVEDLERSNVILTENNRGLLAALDRAQHVFDAVLAQLGATVHAVVELKLDGMEMPPAPPPGMEPARRGPDESEVPEEVMDLIDQRSADGSMKRHLTGEARRRYRELKRSEEWKDETEDKVWEEVGRQISEGEAYP
jgi:hypothetical protein